MTQFLNQNTRIAVVDALRGFAVMAILLVHNLEHFIFPVYPTDSPSWLSTLNQGVFTSIFALLFGFTFYIQASNQRAKGKDFGYRLFQQLRFLLYTH